MPRLPFLILLFGLAIAFGAMMLAATASADSGLPLPRFVSLKSGEVNLRSGPGTQYPVIWIYRHQMLPIEVIAEYQNWRKVRDWDGDEGWMHRNMLSGRRSIIITESTRSLLAAPAPTSPVIARAEPGVVGQLLRCPDEGPYCRIRIGGREGWLDRAAFWGTYTGEVVP